MSKVFLVDIPSEFGVKGIIGDGKMLKFHFNGNCLGEYPIDYNVTTMQEVDVVSVLVSRGEVEVGLNTNQQFMKKGSLLGLADIANRLNMIQGLIFMGRREGSYEHESYSQYIYAFIKGNITPELF